MKVNKKKKGFTLIELIVVIAILGILAAILIPRFSGFQEKARRTQVVTDGKQIATAVESCIADGTITADVADGKSATDPVVKLSGVPLTRITSLSYEKDGGFDFKEKPANSDTTYEVSRADSDTAITVTP